MKGSRWRYRIKQFFEAIFARPTLEDLELARRTLSPAQVSLFVRLQPSEQAHAVRVLRAVQEKCRMEGLALPHDLQVAALLHDVGKTRFPLRIWERVMIVLGKAILPQASSHWGQAAPRGWKRPFVIAAQHPAWGAEMALENGVSSRAVALIRYHQNPLPRPKEDLVGEEAHLLRILQVVDDEE